MSNNDKEILSSTVLKVLDEYILALKSDAEIGEEVAMKMNELLIKGKAPKQAEL